LTELKTKPKINININHNTLTARVQYICTLKLA